VPKVVGPVDPDKPIDINVSGMSPHVFAYKLWWRDATSTDWAELGQGSTGDQQPDFYRHAFSKGAQLFHWLGVGGKANSGYDAIVTLSQGGRVLPNGLVQISGTTNDKGSDVQQDFANFV
jgi:hypothetical protein